jgi:hypothetical protein
MATYYSSGTTARVSFTTRFYLALDAPDPHYAGGTREYGIARPEGGGGNATRPLTGLLHPPDRRGNRAQAAAT